GQWRRHAHAGHVVVGPVVPARPLRHLYAGAAWLPARHPGLQHLRTRPPRHDHNCLKDGITVTILSSDDPVRLLSRLIACPSVTPEEAGALDLLETELTALGFAVTRLRFEGDGSYPVDNLFATRGTSGRRL